MSTRGHADPTSGGPSPCRQTGAVRKLVAIDLAGGPAFVDALRRAWDDGDAVLPVDQRLPGPARAALLAAARPHTIVMGATSTGDDPTATPDSVRRARVRRSSTEAASSGHDDAPRHHGETDATSGGERDAVLSAAQAETVVRLTHERGAPSVAEGDAVVVASSGTTGAPKLLVHTHGSIAAHAEAVHARLDVDPGRDRWLACLPLAHLGGLGVVLRAVITGTPLDVWPSFDADRIARAPAELGSTLVSLVPTALDRTDVSAFRWVVLGGSADPGDRSANVVRTYGLTETGGGVVYDGTPLPGVEVRVDDDGGIALRGATLARGRRLADGTVAPITDNDGWFASGDLGEWTRGGRLVVRGRADDLIVTGGENIWPAPVEAALATHPQVAEVMVVGRPDPEWGQRVVAVVVPTDPHQPPTPDDLRAHVRTTLPAHAAPTVLELVDRLPRTVLGKVRRPPSGPTPT